MHQKDMERFAFLYLCGQEDRSMLTGERRMTFQDFDRLVYIADFLGLDQMEIEILNRFSPQFKKQFENLERMIDENYDNMVSRKYEDDIKIIDKWFADFCRFAPDDAARQFLINIFDIIYDDSQ